jgi:DDE family transposase
MRTSHYRPLAHQVQQQTIALLLQQLRPKDYSRRCSAAVLFSCLVLAAACQRSLAAIASLRPHSPGRETLRSAWHATLPTYDLWRRRLPALLRASLPRGLRKRQRRRRYPLAIDLHGLPYYKRGQTPPAHVRKGKRFAGTCYGHLYATACLLRKGQYYTVALTPYDPDESLAAVVGRLLPQAARNGFAPRYVLMDRSFWAADVFRYLQRARYPFLIPVPARGKKATAPGGPTGTRVFYHNCPSGRYRYQVANRQKQTATLDIVVVRRNHSGRRGKHGRYHWAYGMWRVNMSCLRWVRESYRRRFRIESSYRLLEAARGRTSSRDEGWRLGYVVLAVLLVNAWLRLRREASRAFGAGAEERWWNRLLVALVYLLLAERAQATNPAQRE